MMHTSISDNSITLLKQVLMPIILTTICSLALGPHKHSHKYFGNIKIKYYKISLGMNYLQTIVHHRISTSQIAHEIMENIPNIAT